ncbi:MAG: cytochrome-c oxidase, cbb3-type subunit II [Gammaproteobacteria bacterium]|jgi:cytochrome c oxidase cbb3-type subunit 2|nr:cytochrome-c oxidase, cbb3-type subunit II [Gammaproteobacteria bacterium]MBT3860298.1 cytochrome-c oxidase, cbb3-type subunit II [Gammaproteobacteria bacterium]MBT3987590.1 cytochrome-c oxidase, cbb3-type subunit II [Gammaproteobacteria bacterium]MBT4255918.1 cytochrome-c oxidase, cbb3-type subunit II [Gammaproteobacteria bacterium]MBT4581672.1 cytochrome-c oxidase, cbb3-type subunit II [Gammaproteobacteria bacterium]
MSGLSLHKKIEENIGLLIFGILVVSSIGGLVQIVPILNQESLETATINTRVYSAVELTGRDIYIREGCHVCHSQQIRPLIAEVERYGPYSRAGEFVYDRPFLWGSKRTGPDLHRVGGKFSDDWHRIHLIDPREVVSKSIMPGYPWLAERDATQAGDISAKMSGLKFLGHPYSDEEIASAPEQLEGLKEIDALIAYLQMLGTGLSEEQTL